MPSEELKVWAYEVGKLFVTQSGAVMRCEETLSHGGALLLYQAGNSQYGERGDARTHGPFTYSRKGLVCYGNRPDLPLNTIDSERRTFGPLTIVREIEP